MIHSKAKMVDDDVASVGCCINEQGSGCPHPQLSKLTSTTHMSASQFDYACKLPWFFWVLEFHYRLVLETKK